MNVLVVTPGLDPDMGGAAFSEAALCQTLSQFADVTVACRRGRFHASFAKRHGIENPLFFDPIDWAKAYFHATHPLSQAVAKADIVHLNGHWRWENTFVSKVCKKKGTPYVFHPRGMLLLGHRRVLLKWLFNQLLGKSVVSNASKVIALSEFEVDSQFSSYSMVPERVSVIPNGIDFPDTLPARTKDDFFLYFGRLEKRKNLIFLIEAFDLYLKEGGDCSLVLMGPSERGYREQLERFVELHHLGDRVQFIRPQYGIEKWRLIRSARAVLYPAKFEAFGRVPFEAVGAGCPVVLPERSGATEYLSKYLEGCFYADGSKSELAEALTRLEGAAPPRLEEGRRWVHQNLSWSRVGENLHSLYRSLLLESPLTSTVEGDLGARRLGEEPSH